MANNVLKARVKQKYDTAANWAKATTFVPLAGEICVYDNGDGQAPQMKIGDGKTTVVNLPFVKDNNTTYNIASTSASGLMSAADKGKLDGITSGANAYSLPLATSSVRGGVKVGYAANGKNYPVQLSNEQMYVNVPWTDTNTTYGAAGSSLGLMKSGGDLTITNGVATVNDDSHNHVISNVDGLQSAIDAKLRMNTSGGIKECAGNGENLYFKIATIKISTNYINRPAVFELSGRGRGLSTLTVRFKNANGVDPDIDVFSSNWDTFWIKKTAASTWEIYGNYSEPWGMCVLHRITGAGANIGITVNMENIGNELPTGCTQTSTGGVASHAISANSLTTSAGSATQPIYFSNGKPAACTYTLGASVPSNAKFTDTVYTLPVAGSAIGGVKSGTDITVDSSGNVSVKNDSHTHSNSTITSLDSSKLTGTIPTSLLPSYVDDVLEYNGKSNFPATGATGKIYVDTSTNKTYRWSGSAYVEISASLALGTTSSTAFRGDYGNTAYSHATAKGSAFASGLYKITTNAQGHVTAAAAVQKADITALGIPASNTTYSNMGAATASAAGTAGLVPAPGAGKQTSFLRGDGTWVVPTNTTYSAGVGISLSGTTFSNSGVRSIASGSANGTISVNTNGTTANVAVKGLGSNAYTSTGLTSIGTAQPTSSAYSLWVDTDEEPAYAMPADAIKYKAFNIATSAWSGSGPFTYTITAAGITTNTVIINLTLDAASQANQKAQLDWETKAGTITLSTVTKPTGTISGYLITAEATII